MHDKEKLPILCVVYSLQYPLLRETFINDSIITLLLHENTQIKWTYCLALDFLSGVLNWAPARKIANVRHRWAGFVTDHVSDLPSSYVSNNTFGNELFLAKKSLSLSLSEQLALPRN